MSTIQQTVERSFFEAIRLALVANGYTPDIANTTLYPDTPAGFEAYLAALATIKASKGFAIEVFGTANPNSRGMKQLPRIVVQTTSFFPGNVGFDSSPQLVKNPDTNKYESFSYDGLSYDLTVAVTASAKDQVQLRKLMDLTHGAIPILGYLPYYNNGSDGFMVKFDSFQDEVDPREGSLDYTYLYLVPDIQWREPVKLTGTIEPIDSIGLNLKIGERLGINYIF